MQRFTDAELDAELDALLDAATELWLHARAAAGRVVIVRLGDPAGTRFAIHESRYDNPVMTTAQCSSCWDSGYACEEHPDRPWGGVVVEGCLCGGAGIPCPECAEPLPQDGTRAITAAFVPRAHRPG